MTEQQKAEMLADIDEKYRQFCTYIDSLTDDRLINRTDSAGWTPKDHIIHCAKWAEGMVAVLRKEPRWEGMGVTRETWATVADHYDVVNEAIRQAHAHLSVDEVCAAFRETHETLMGLVSDMSVDDLTKPYEYYQPWAEGNTYPVYGYIKGNTGDHYLEHMEYIKATVA